MRGLEEEQNSLGTEEACAKMWSVYISQAEKYDKALVAGWRADMKGILIFAGLFSGSLTAFIIESYRTLTPDPGNMAVLILAQISRQLNATTEGPVPAASLKFVTPTSALICNGLWFTSLGLSLASAVIATLVEQWARDYLNKSDMRPSPIDRARICSYLYSGLKHFRMHVVVDLIPPPPTHVPPPIFRRPRRVFVSDKPGNGGGCYVPPEYCSIRIRRAHVYAPPRRQLPVSHTALRRLLAYRADRRSAVGQAAPWHALRQSQHGGGHVTPRNCRI
ncbi:hypothetical protein MVEN_02448000 [Mycena venus]|uniref:DUF6535 domain-containing protein n=1 Tax=Mycena venus TaxID=2733690 RepID=A0A8H7CCH2_9AGAR|nr:hypothetical protein MVEN_02448000 [Mycena venus]